MPYDPRMQRGGMMPSQQAVFDPYATPETVCAAARHGRAVRPGARAAAAQAVVRGPTGTVERPLRQRPQTGKAATDAARHADGHRRHRPRQGSPEPRADPQHGNGQYAGVGVVGSSLACSAAEPPQIGAAP